MNLQRPGEGGWMLKTLVSAVRQALSDFAQAWRGSQTSLIESAAVKPAEPAIHYRPLEKIVLTDDVSRTLFEEYADHRAGVRGEDETGWLLLGLRQEREAIAMATLPAGTECEAGVAHVRFNSTAQALASRIVRQEDRQLGIVGVVHTHPGRLRHPSHGDYLGDKEWVRLLRGRDGVFGIGTAEGPDGLNPHLAAQPKQNTQCYLGLRFSWYALGEDDRAYRPLPVELTIGPDLARPLHSLWSTIERHAGRLDRLCRTIARVRFAMVSDEKGPALQMMMPLGENEESLRVILRGPEVEYCLVHKEQWLVSDSREPLVDRGVYLMLAALAARAEEG